MDLREPEGEIDEGKKICVDGAEGIWPGHGVEREEEDAEHEDAEAGVEGAHSLVGTS